MRSTCGRGSSACLLRSETGPLLQGLPSPHRARARARAIGVLHQGWREPAANASMGWTASIAGTEDWKLTGGCVREQGSRGWGRVHRGCKALLRWVLGPEVAQRLGDAAAKSAVADCGRIQQVLQSKLAELVFPCAQTATSTRFAGEGAVAQCP